MDADADTDTDTDADADAGVNAIALPGLRSGELKRRTEEQE